jgi:hypothetical protein
MADTHSKDTFTTQAGVVVRCRAVSDTLLTMALARIEKEFRDRGEPLDPPTYTVKIALPGGDGGEETHAHDEKTLDDPDPDVAKANHAAWNAYQDAQARLAKAQNEKREWLWYMAGLQFEMSENGWAEEQEALFGIAVPAEPQARRMHYIKTVLLPTMDDLMKALETVTLLSYSGLVDPEVVRASIASFRHQLQGPAAAGDLAAAERLAAQPALQ